MSPQAVNQALAGATSGIFQNEIVPSPLQCGEYRHVVEAHTEYCNHGTQLSNCSFTMPAQCVDDMHEITESEWQTILKRLAKLEYRGPTTE